MRYANPPPEGTIVELSKCCHAAVWVWKNEDLITTCAACDQVCEVEKVRLKLSEALNAKEWPTEKEIKEAAFTWCAANWDPREKFDRAFVFEMGAHWLRERMKVEE